MSIEAASATNNLELQSQLHALLPLVEAYFQTHQATLPTLGHRSTQILSMGEHIMTANISELLLLIRSDATAAAEILRLANSPLYRGQQTISGLDEAIIRLGRRNIYQLLAETATRGLFESSIRQLYNLFPLHWYRLHHHAVTCAFGSGWLSTYLKQGQYETAFMAGMFHDIGKLGALHSLGNLIINGAIKSDVSFTATSLMMEAVHTQMGCSMLSRWQLSGIPFEVTARMHLPADPNIPQEPQLHIVRVVSSLNILRENAFVPDTLDAELRESLTLLDLKNSHIEAIGSKLQKIVDQVSFLLGPRPEVGKSERS